MKHPQAKNYGKKCQVSKTSATEWTREWAVVIEQLYWSSLATKGLRLDCPLKAALRQISAPGFVSKEGHGDQSTESSQGQGYLQVREAVLDPYRVDHGGGDQTS